MYLRSFSDTPYLRKHQLLLFCCMRSRPSLYEMLMTFICREVQEVQGQLVVIDGEENIIRAINKCLPCGISLRCWNHLLSSARYRLKKHGATTGEYSAYTQDIKQLLMSTSEEEYRKLYSTLSGRWSQPFCGYYHSSIEHEVVSTSGRWIIEPHRILVAAVV